MEYRKLPHGDERIGVLGLGMGGIQKCSEEQRRRMNVPRRRHRCGIG